MNPSEVWTIPISYIGRRVLFYDLVDSTSSRCSKMAIPENDGIVVLAKNQTAGRGQHGRSWQSKPGQGLLLSILLFPPEHLRQPAILTAWAAVSVCNVMGHLDLVATIKWPNDILIQNKKVCGILIEQKQGIIVGIGLNLNQNLHDFTQLKLADAGSLHMFTGQSYDCKETAHQLIESLDQTYRKLLTDGTCKLEVSWRKHLGLMGKNVLIELAKETKKGVLLEIGFDGLLLKENNNELVILPPEQIQHILSYPPE